MEDVFGEILDFGILQRRRLGIKQGPQKEHKLWSPYAQWLFPFLFVQNPVSDFPVFLRIRALQHCFDDEFILNVNITQVHFKDSSSARQLCSRQGVGKIRHLSGKVLWVRSKVQSDEVELVQMPTAFNIANIGTKSLARRRLYALMGELGMVEADSCN